MGDSVPAYFAVIGQEGWILGSDGTMHERRLSQTQRAPLCDLKPEGPNCLPWLARRRFLLLVGSGT